MDHLWDMSIVPLGDDNIAIQSKAQEKEKAIRPATASTTQRPTTLAGLSSKKTLPGVTQARSQDTLKERNVPVFQPSSSRKRTICQTLETQASPHTSSSRSQEKKLKTTHNTTTTNIKEEHQDQLIKSSNPIAPKPRRPRPSSTHLFPITKKKGNARTKEGSKEAVDKSPMADAQVYDRIVEFIIVEI